MFKKCHCSARFLLFCIRVNDVCNDLYVTDFSSRIKFKCSINKPDFTDHCKR